MPGSRRVLAVMYALAALACAQPARASCLPVLDPELAALEALADKDPKSGAAAVRARLADPMQRTTSRLAAQAWAIYAEASIGLSRPDDVRRGLAAARRELAAIPPDDAASTAIVRVRHRLVLSEAMLAVTRAAHEASLAEIDRLLDGVLPASIERSCALIARSQKHSDLGLQDRAAADAMTAHRLAVEGNWGRPRADAAFVLAIAYRRSGLFDAAERMAAEAVAFAEQQHEPANLSGAEYTRGQALYAAGRWEDAKRAMQRSAAAAREAGDPFGVAAAAQVLCATLVELRDYDAANRACRPDDAVYAQANRRDLGAEARAWQARIALERGRTADALALIDAAFAVAVPEYSAALEAHMRSTRARILAALGRNREAYADLERVATLERSSDAAERARAVTVLAAAAEAERLVAANRVLQARTVSQADELAARELTQRLWIGLAVGALLVAVLLGYVATATRRHARELRRQQAILATVTSNAPDALLLLDPNRRVQFANRSPFGDRAAPAAGATLAEVVPADARAEVEAAVERVLRERLPESFAAAVTDPDGVVRHFEVRVVPVFAAAELIGATLRTVDVTERRRLEREVIDVVGRERHRLSSDLHEGLGQELTGVSLLLRSLVQRASRGQPPSAAELSEIGDHVGRTIDMTRELARGLSPVQIERGSLTDALARLAAEANRRLRLDVHVQCEPPDVVASEAAADHLYRIAYEALTNAARHSGCARVDIELEAHDSRLSLAIVDDGCGLPDAGPDRWGIGLKLMAYRARLMGGTLRIEPGPQRGTRVCVEVPAGA
jgi:PAS domain S-box-containing protein